VLRGLDDQIENNKV